MDFQTLTEGFVYFKEAHIYVKLKSNAYVCYQQNKVNCFHNDCLYALILYYGRKKRTLHCFPPLDLDFCDID